MEPDRPDIDSRDRASILAELLDRRPGYLPTLKPVPRGPSHALLEIFSRDMEALIRRLNLAPDKNKLAFLDTLGLSLLPAGSARAVVAFTAAPNAADAGVPEGARVGAKVEGRSGPVVFETESAVALAGANLVEAVSLWPDRDEYADHSSSLAGGRPFTLFEPRTPVEHAIYLAHDTVFALSGMATVDLEIELAQAGNSPLPIVWEHWDGQAWRAFAPFDAADQTMSQDRTAGLTTSGIVTLVAECGKSVKTQVNGIEAQWIRGRLDHPLPPDPDRVLPTIDRIRLRSVIKHPFVPDDPTKQPVGDLRPDQALAESAPLDLTKSFFPFGPSPGPDSAFYISSEEAFGKPGAKVTISFQRMKTPQEEADAGESPVPTPPSAGLTWEFWNGAAWEGISDLAPSTGYFDATGQIGFTIPERLQGVEVNGTSARWIRARLTSGSYTRVRRLKWNTNTLQFVEPRPPLLDRFLLSYVFRARWQAPEHLITYNDFQYAIEDAAAKSSGMALPPFRPVSDTLPALYLGFDRPLPNDLVGLFFDLPESAAPGPALVWESWDGRAWSALVVADQTGALSRPGIVSFVPTPVPSRPTVPLVAATGASVSLATEREAEVFAPGDRIVVGQGKTEESAVVAIVSSGQLFLEAPLFGSYTGGSVRGAGLPRFGTPLDWVRGRLKEDGSPLRSDVNGVYLNATWARQIDTYQDEVLGSGTGELGQTVFFRQFPVLPGEWIEVREVEGPRAQVELPLLREELLAEGFAEDDIRTSSDPRTGAITEIWVRWQSKPDLFFSGPDDRHYVVERSLGRVTFGDGRRGRVPAVGANNLRVHLYSAGGGPIGNVPAGAINQLLTAVPSAQSAGNPRAADGGAAGEPVSGIATRGPQVLRHRWRALSAQDYEALAREASPAVAAVRALPTTAPNGLPAPGWVTLVVVPQSQDPRPEPSFELRQEIHDYVAARAPATVSPDHIGVISPTYLPIGVAATVVALDPGESGRVREQVSAAVASFLHPLTGGPDGVGWPFGRDAYLSDLAAVVEAVPGVDHAENLELLVDDVPIGERVPVPPDRMVVAGPIRIETRLEQGAVCMAAGS